MSRLCRASPLLGGYGPLGPLLSPRRGAPMVRAAAARVGAAGGGREDRVSTESKYFCPLPWVHFYTEPNGTVSLCCVANPPLVGADQRALSIQRQPAREIWNGEAFRHARRQMASGEPVDFCSYCYRNEENGVPSYRQFALGEFREVQGRSIAEIVRESAARGWAADDPVYVDLRLGNLCNLKCRMCHPDFSSQIERDPIHAGWRRGDRDTSLPGLAHRFDDNLEHWSESLELIEELAEFTEEVEFIQLAGGEPTINKAQLQLLQRLVERDQAKRIRLTIWSNLTSVQPGFYRLLENFAQVVVYGSTDGFGATYEYIRFPGDWAAFDRNARALTRLPRLCLFVSPVLQAYNALDLTRLYDWCLEVGARPQINILNQPLYLDYRILPMAARTLAAERLAGWIARHRGHPLVDDKFAASLDGLVGALANEEDRLKGAPIEDFMRFTDDLDASRGQDIRTALPELFALWRDARGWRGTRSG
jgi:MoaA/NifB/PqqE/SkfB family radical SAM enzyme